MFGIKNFKYREFCIDVGPKTSYLLSPEIYTAGTLRVLVTPIFRKLVLFENDNKITDTEGAREIINQHYNQIKEKKDNADSMAMETISKDPINPFEP